MAGLLQEQRHFSFVVQENSVKLKVYRSSIFLSMVNLQSPVS